MALKTDDEDIRDIRMWMEVGGNGDYYFNLIDKSSNVRLNFRVSTSGGNAPTAVKVAVATLFRAMEAAKLNEP